MPNRDLRTYAIIGAAMEVHRKLCSGFLEAVWHETLALEMTRRGIPHKREVLPPVTYKGRRLASLFRVDFVCYDAVSVEVKALARLSANEQSQIINYLKATGLKTGLLLNFGAPSLQYKRFTHSHPPSIESA